MPKNLTRRQILQALPAVLLPSALRAASEPVDLDWVDLQPDGGGFDMQALRDMGVVQHGELSTPFDQERGAKVTTEYNGQRVRIPGYLIPLDFQGTGVTAAMLVPYVGACIHVPPPPPNQLIYLSTDVPYESQGLFEAVYATGTLSTEATMTALAEIGYSMQADLIEPYR